MTRPDLKEDILHAAEAIVLESGAGHMTLDAVAERANISKGGLMYNFRTKEVLLEAMISRLMEKYEELREKARRNFPSGASPLLVEIKMFMELSETDFRLSSALLAVNANQPELLDGFRENVRDRLINEIATPGHFERSAVLFFAAFGLHVHELLKIPLLSKQQKRNLFKELMRLANSDERQLH